MAKDWTKKYYYEDKCRTVVCIMYTMKSSAALLAQIFESVLNKSHLILKTQASEINYVNFSKLNDERKENNIQKSKT